jgi:hypothetical protein
MDVGVHPENRGRAYVNGERCKEMMSKVLQQGFSKDELNQKAVVVEDQPSGPNDGPIQKYNAEHSRKDPLLCELFTSAWGALRYGALSHNHMYVCLRAWKCAAKWPIDPLTEKPLVFNDADGRLNISAVAAHPDCRELHEVLHEGLLVEVLSYKMDVEEPQAASLICQALQAGNEVAMRTSEITALSYLKGEILINRKNLGFVEYNTVREKLRERIDYFVDDPDFPELFTFVTNLGVGTNDYVEQLMDYLNTYVNSKVRQLRLAAFKNVNLIDIEYPRIKVALIKRAYRKKPTFTWCPHPELGWSRMNKNELEVVEEFLHYVHHTCRAWLTEMFTVAEKITFFWHTSISHRARKYGTGKPPHLEAT